MKPVQRLKVLNNDYIPIIDNEKEKYNSKTTLEYKRGPKFDMNYNLPIIGIPENKIISFCEWFDTDLYTDKLYLQKVPQVFKEGYIFIEKIPLKYDILNLNNFIKSLAKSERLTFRTAETGIKDVYKAYSENIILYFKFDDKYKLVLNYYSTIDNEQLGGLSLTNELWNTPIELENKYKIDDSKQYLFIKDIFDCDITHNDIFQKGIQEYYIKIFTSALWYIALYKNKYKYERHLAKDDVKEIITKKQYKHHNCTQVLTTSFYDLSRTPHNKVSTLTKKRVGFEYSYQFDVKGHYRHYRDGKVVYINSYTKANDKPRQQKQLLLIPKA